MWYTAHVLAVFFASLYAGGVLGARSHVSRSFFIQDNKFFKDGTPFQIVSGEIMYSRIPPEYWRDRLMRIRSLGLNAIQTYVPWNFHEAVPGEFDFSGWRNISQFIQIANETGLLVLLRPGPYICAEWDFGGLPAWLLSNNVTGRKINVRTSDPVYLHFVQRWWSKLFDQVAPFTYSNGGPIVMSQIENEYGYYGYDKKYLKFLLNMTRTFLGEDIIVYTTDTFNPAAAARGTLVGEKVFTAVDFPPATNLQGAFTVQQFFNAPGKSPPFCAEFYTGWLSHWGEPMANISTSTLAKGLKELLEYANSTTSVSLYMGHGGTNFGFWAGANIIHSPIMVDAGFAEGQLKGKPNPKDSTVHSAHAGYLPTQHDIGQHKSTVDGQRSNIVNGANLFDFDLTPAAGTNRGFDVYLPHITSYDYDCPIGEAGTTGQLGIGGESKFDAIRQVLSQHFKTDLPSPLPEPDLASYGEVELTRAVLLVDVLDCMTPQGPVTGQYPEPMEQYGQSFGVIAYRTTLANDTLTRGGLLAFTPHDLAIVFLGRSPIGYIWRNSRLPQLSLPPTFEETELIIVVEAMGRNNFGTGLYKGLVDRKGLVTNVTLDGSILTDWEVLPLPMDNLTCVTQPPETAQRPLATPQHQATELIRHPQLADVDELRLNDASRDVTSGEVESTIQGSAGSTDSADLSDPTDLADSPNAAGSIDSADSTDPTDSAALTYTAGSAASTATSSLNSLGSRDVKLIRNVFAHASKGLEQPSPAPLLAPPVFFVGGFSVASHQLQPRTVYHQVHATKGKQHDYASCGRVRGTACSASTADDGDAGQFPMDTFLNMRGWDKGVVWVNGHNVGRYWQSRGPQNTLYVPGPWLKEDWNEVVVLELLAVPGNRTLTSQDKPDFHRVESFPHGFHHSRHKG